MANTIVNSRQKLIDYCMRRLGHPVIKINIDDQQIQDRIDDAIQFWTTFHYSGVVQTFHKHTITQEEMDRFDKNTDRYIILPDDIIQVIRCFPVSPKIGGLFNVGYQLVMADLYNYGSIDLLGYSITMSHMTMLQQLLAPEKTVHFNVVDNRLYLDTSWKDNLTVDSVIALECYRSLNPDYVENDPAQQESSTTANPAGRIPTRPAAKVFDDLLFKKYCTALIKRQWGQNLSKFQGVALPGGIMLNSDKILDEATNEIIAIELETQNTWQEPPKFCTG